MNDPIAMNIDQFQKELMRRLSELETLQASSADSRKTVMLDQSSVGRLSRMDAIQGQQMAAETDRRRATEILRIKSALRRIETEDFGYCIRCDEQISPKRLENDPSVPLCIDCAKKP